MQLRLPSLPKRKQDNMIKDVSFLLFTATGNYNLNQVISKMVLNSLVSMQGWRYLIGGIDQLRVCSKLDNFSVRQ